MNRYIREGRFGKGKQFKTGSVVGTYPRPLLCLQTDEEGLSVINDPITIIDPKDFESWCKKKPEELDQNGIYSVDFTNIGVTKQITNVYQPTGEKVGFQTFVDTANKLLTIGCPWKTIVVDSISSLSDMIMAHNASVNASSLSDARKWAGNVGGKVAQIVKVLCSVDAHVVFIMHEDLEKNELSGEVTIYPLIHSKFRQKVGAELSQFFYQTMENGKAVIYTQNKGLIKGIGARWPQNLPAVCGADFKSIYGKEQI